MLGWNGKFLIDKQGNYYILNETAMMQYSILLDTYTTISEEFKKKYDEGKEQVKVGMNTEKIIQALNLKDYKYIYNKLDNQFKNNNFDTLEKFKDYMQQHYPDTYDVQYSNIEIDDKSQIYMQPITLISKQTDQEINNTIIMKLNDNYDFVMSFNIDE